LKSSPVPPERTPTTGQRVGAGRVTPDPSGVLPVAAARLRNCYQRHPAGVRGLHPCTRCRGQPPYKAERKECVMRFHGDFSFTVYQVSTDLESLIGQVQAAGLDRPEAVKLIAERIAAKPGLQDEVIRMVAAAALDEFKRDAALS
jgi:hypothetical protein